MNSINSISESHGTFRDFQDLLTSYRISCVLLIAHELGIFDALEHGPGHAEDICRKTGMDRAYGLRFLDVLCHLGFLDKENGFLGLSDFSKQFLIKTADSYQGDALVFEKKMVESWQNLSQTLCQGKRVYNVMEKSPEEYRAALGLYLGAMDNVARIRAKELWDRINPGQGGLILDAGAGSGAFLMEFLKRHPSWRGVFCDLPDVIHLALDNPEIKPFLNRLDFKAVNFLDDDQALESVRADIVLCSNVVHCQGRDETQLILSRLVPALAEQGLLLVHDFFIDAGYRGALYDLHMMLNTYNGRTYMTSDLCNMLSPLGLAHHKVLNLSSTSSALVFSKIPTNQGFFV
ncbi:MAG: hypothetical protein KKD44_24150 [Proteobacteria bacterium]|nr:hypothetical protein [Pseudomonadota bacterium]